MELWRWASENLVTTIFLFIPCVLVAFGLSGIACKETWQEFGANKKVGKWFLGIFLLGLILRAGWIAYTQPAPISDYIDYWQEASRLAVGDWSFPNIDKHPGIIILMTACFKLWGATPWGIWALNLVFAGLSMILLYRIGALLTDQRGGLASMLLFAVQPQLIAYSALFASEAPTIFFYLLLTWFTIRASRQSTTLLQWLMLGATLYAAVLTRSTTLLFLLLIPLTALLFHKDPWTRVFKQCAVFGLTACLLLSSWLYHQQLLTGKAQLFWGSEIWLVSTTHYQTQGRLVNPWALPGLDKQIQQATAGLNGVQNRLTALETMKAWAMPIIQTDPWRYISEGRVRLRHILWTTSETGIRDSQTGSANLSRWPGKTITRMAEVSKQTWRITLVLGLAGFALLLYRRRHAAAQAAFLLIGGFLSVWTGFHYLMAVASDRWAVQIIPFILLFAGCGLVESLRTLNTLRALNKKALQPSSHTAV